MAGSPFGNISENFVRSPLGIIALFIVLVYAMAGLVTAWGEFPETHLMILVVFLVAFPVLVLFVFFWLVTRYPNLIYGPADFQEEENFLRLRGMVDDASETLRKYWRPDGKIIDSEHNQAIIEWMRHNRLMQLSVPIFLKSARFQAERKQAVADLGLM